jgi:hypothetical protein
MQPTPQQPNLYIRLRDIFSAFLTKYRAEYNKPDQGAHYLYNYAGMTWSATLMHESCVKGQTCFVLHLGNSKCFNPPLPAGCSPFRAKIIRRLDGRDWLHAVQLPAEAQQLVESISTLFRMIFLDKIPVNFDVYYSEDMAQFEIQLLDGTRTLNLTVDFSPALPVFQAPSRVVPPSVTLISAASVAAAMIASTKPSPTPTDESRSSIASNTVSS